MTTEVRRLALVTALLAVLVAAGAGREALASEEGEDGEDGEVHHGLEFFHPLVSNTPLPENYARFTYDYQNEPRHHHEPGADRHSWVLNLEYAPIRSFSLELQVPWTYLDPDEGGSASRLDNIELVSKYANFSFADEGLLLGGGLKLELPTGDEEKRIGSSHLWVIEPFLDFGYKLNRFELVGFVDFGFPVNEGSEEEPDLELGWNLSFTYLITDRFHYLLEFEGEHDFGGPEDFNVVNISPGIKYQILKRRLSLGLSVRLPLTQDKEFYVSPRFSVFYNF